MRRTSAYLFLAVALVGQTCLFHADAKPADFGIKAPLKGWMVPPLSAKRILPDLPEPPDRLEKVAGIDLIAAIGEDEPASFVLRSSLPVKALSLVPTELTAPGGASLPASVLDLYVVSVWYQGGNAWFMGDREPGPAVLVPELLLHDPALATAAATKKNRIKTAAGVVEIDENTPAPAKPLLAAGDAKRLAPVSLRPKELRQFYLLARIPATAKPGVYVGSVALTADGKEAGAIPVTLRVLPFRLPAATTRYDRDRPFAVLLQGGGLPASGPLAATIARQGVTHVIAPAAAASAAKDGVAWVDAGKALSEGAPLPSPAGLSPEKVFLVRDPADRSAPSAKALEKAILAGYRTAIAADPDEIYETCSPVVSACLCDPLPLPHLVMRWHAIGARLVSTAPLALAGVENPEVWRRRTGFLPYQQGADGVLLPALYDSTSWTDSDAKRPGAKRAPALVYPTTGAPVPTLAWEGVREGVDDLRYMTLLSKLVDGCLASPDAKIRTEGRLAGVWIDQMRARSGDLDGLRLEAIAWILRLQQVYALAAEGGADHE